MKVNKKKKVPHFTYEISEEEDIKIDLLLEQLNNKKIKHEVALQTFYEIADSHPLYPTVFFAIGVVFILGKKYQHAIPYFTKAAKLNPFFIDAIFNNALAHAELGDIGGQLLLLNNIVEVGNKHDEIVIKAIEIMKSLESLIQETHKIDLYTYIKNTKRFKFAQEKMKIGKWDLAIPVLENLLKKSPDIPAILNNLALCHAQKGKKQLAIQHLNSALEIDADYLPAITNIHAIENNMLEGKPLAGQQAWSFRNNPCDITEF